MLHLTVSAENIKRLAVLVAWSDDAIAEFESLLETGVSHFRARNAVREAFAKATHVPEAEAADILEAIVPLLIQYVGEGNSPSLVAESVVAGVRRAAQRTSLTTDGELGVLRARLERLLANESLLLKAKATELVYERGRILNKVRIVSDMRPVFGSKGPATVDALTVIHTLVVTYTEDQDRRKLHLALDTKDLEALRDVVGRALEKQKALDAFAKTSGVRKFDIV